VNFTQALGACEEMKMEMVIINNINQMEPLRQKIPKGDYQLLFFYDLSEFFNYIWAQKSTCGWRHRTLEGEVANFIGRMGNRWRPSCGTKAPNAPSRTASRRDSKLASTFGPITTVSAIGSVMTPKQTSSASCPTNTTHVLSDAEETFKRTFICTTKNCQFCFLIIFVCLIYRMGFISFL
jgi:hypothetical protein